MQSILIVLLLFLGVFAIITSDLKSTHRANGKESISKKTPIHSAKKADNRPMSFDIGYINGDDVIYIDRQIFRESLRQHLAKEKKFKIKYNPFMEIDFWVHQKVIYKKLYKATYRGRLQFRVEKKLVIKMRYAIYNSKKHPIFRDNFTYRVIIKAGSTISYKEADHKAHRKLFWILGKKVARRLNRYYKRVY